MNSPLQLFPQRIAIGKVSVGGRDQHVYMTPEFYRALREVLARIGGSSSDIPDLDQILLSEVMASVPGELSTDYEAQSMVVGQSGASVDSDPMAMELTLSPSMESDSSPLPFMSVAVLASPMTFVADRKCAICVAGGSVSSMIYARAASSVDVTGALLVEMSRGDTLTITYSSAPTMTLIPR